MSAYKKLSEIQRVVKAPKNQYNNFGKYYYRSCEDILEAVKPLLEDTNSLLCIEDEVVNSGDRYYVKATATLYDVDSETSVSVSAFAREEESKKGMDGSQITGASSSYARKYALNGLFCLDDTKDADDPKQSNGNGNSKTEEKPQQAKENPKTKLYREIVALAKEIGETEGDVKARIKEQYGKTKGSDVTMQEFEELMKHYIEQAKEVG